MARGSAWLMACGSSMRGDKRGLGEGDHAGEYIDTAVRPRFEDLVFLLDFLGCLVR